MCYGNTQELDYGQKMHSSPPARTGVLNPIEGKWIAQPRDHASYSRFEREMSGSLHGPGKQLVQDLRKNVSDLDNDRRGPYGIKRTPGKWANSGSLTIGSLEEVVK